MHYVAKISGADPWLMDPKASVLPTTPLREELEGDGFYTSRFLLTLTVSDFARSLAETESSIETRFFAGRSARLEQLY